MRGRPFQPGNTFGRGRPPGSRNKSSQKAQELLDSHAEPLIQKCILMALQGEIGALRLCLERLLPPRREMPMKMKRIRSGTAGEIAQSHDDVLKGLSSGQVTTTQAQVFTNILEGRRRVIETVEHERRLQELESNNAKP